MNTDNMTISGETIDYGPCAFMEAYDPATVFSSIDTWGRYAYGDQPAVAAWNLARFAETLLPLFADDLDQALALAQESLGGFRRQYDAAWSAGMRAKLGLRDVDDDVAHAVDLRTPRAACSRAVSTTRRSTVSSAGRRAATSNRRADCSSTLPRSTVGWRAGGHLLRTRTRWTGSIPCTSRETIWSRRRLPRRPTGDLDPLSRLLAAVTAPYDERPGLERYAEPAPEDFGAYRTFCGT